MKRIPIYLATLSTALASPTDGAVLHVPSDYETIYAATLAAVSGDTIEVAPGTYGHVEVIGGLTTVGWIPGGVSLVAPGGPDVTTLRGMGTGVPGQAANLLALFHTEPISIEGFSFESAGGSMGGVRAKDGEAVTVRNCVFRGLDWDGWDGAGVSAVDVTELTVEDCEFYDGVADLAGGIYCWAPEIGGSLRVSRCRFERLSGGAVRGSDLDGIEIRDSVFLDCAGRPALYVGAWSSVVERCWFEGNVSPNAGGGGLHATRVSVVRDNVFVGNSSGSVGGGVYFDPAGPSVLERNLFFGNEAAEGPGSPRGAALYVLSPPAPVRNNIFVGNAGREAIETNFPNVVGPSITCNVFWDNPDGDFNGTLPPSNVAADPLFCDASAGDYTLQPASPALPENSGPCGTIGPNGIGCGGVSLEGTSWAQIKAMFQE